MVNAINCNRTVAGPFLHTLQFDTTTKFIFKNKKFWKAVVLELQELILTVSVVKQVNKSTKQDAECVREYKTIFIYRKLLIYSIVSI